MNKISQNIIKIGAATLIENKKGEILIVRSPKTSEEWTMPGGHVEYGETIAEAAIREAKEETGLNVAYKKIIRFCEVINKNDGFLHMISFHTHCISKDTKIELDNRELLEYKWVKPEVAAKMDIFKDFKDTIVEFINQNKYEKN